MESNRAVASTDICCIVSLAQLYQFVRWKSDFCGVLVPKRESNQRRPIANRL